LIRWIQHAAWIDLLELGLVVALAVGLAHWTWMATSPRVVAAPGTLADAGESQPGAPLAGTLFGAAGSGEAKTGSATLATGFTLLGVFSGPTPTAGRAILAVQGSRPAIVAAGEPVAEGILLQEVHPDHVVVLRQGVPERIELERRKAQAAPQPQPKPAPARR
jgi:general secretion pathway protein C